MDINQCTKQLEQSRYELYQNLDNRADAVMDLLDAMSSTGAIETIALHWASRELCQLVYDNSLGWFDSRR